MAHENVLYSLTGFSSLRDYGRALAQYPWAIMHRPGHKRSVDDMLEAKLHEGKIEMKPTLVHRRAVTAS